MTERTNPHMGIVVGAEDKTAQGFDSVKRRAADMADGVEKSANKAAQAVGSIGDKAQPAAGKVDAAARSIIGSIERATATMNAGEKGTASYYEALGKLRGVNQNVLDPYITQLKQAEAAQRALLMSQATQSSSVVEHPSLTSTSTPISRACACTASMSRPRAAHKSSGVSNDRFKRPMISALRLLLVVSASAVRAACKSLGMRSVMRV